MTYVEIDKFRDGGLVISFGEDQDLDLCFTNGAMHEEDPIYAKQLAILRQIAEALKATGLYEINPARQG